MVIATGIIFAVVRMLTSYIAQRNTYQSRMQAYAFADEAIKIAQSLDPAAFAAACPSSESCIRYLSQSSDVFSLVNTPQEQLDQIFTRTIQIIPIGLDTDEHVIKSNPPVIDLINGYEIKTIAAWNDSTGEHRVELPWTISNQ